VSPRRTKIPVDNDNGDQNCNDVDNESEQKILGYQWNIVRCWWEDLGDEKKKDNKSEQY